ncbi:MAG: aspartate-semialdehyde dehydrogenase [Thermoanaerobaculales bacterium]
MSRRLRVAILGATGTVGQKLVTLLDGHPWFEVSAVTASERSAGKRYGDAVRWLEPTPLPDSMAALPVLPAMPPPEADLALSALDAGTAREVEPACARAGLAVVSNASAWRMHPHVPLLIPEVNMDHLALLAAQDWRPGFIVANPNCSTTGLACVLAPLDLAFGVSEVHVTTLQAVSGAGYPGTPSLEVLGNVIPFIAGEEEKIESETRKVLGRFAAGGIEPAPIRISAHANRVPVLDGHMLCISAKLRRRASVTQVRAALADYQTPLGELGLPSAPLRLLYVFGDNASPQPRLHAFIGSGMTVSVGRVRPCPLLDVRFVALVHNTVRGAAGATLLNAELLVQRGLLPIATRSAPRSRRSVKLARRPQR